MRYWQAVSAAVFVSALLAGCGRPKMTDSSIAPDETVDGAKIYAANCMVCHGADGKGLANVFPPLAGTDWVKGPPRRLIALTLDGLNGPEKVYGVVYRGMMPAWRYSLNDQKIAAVLTYVRQEWGNNASPVSALEISQLRMETEARKIFWTDKELMEMEAAGKPVSTPADKGK